MTISNSDQDQHWHGVTVVVIEDDVPEYGSVRLQSEVHVDVMLYEGSLVQCEAVKAMFDNVSKSLDFALTNDIDPSNIVQSFRKSSTMER